MTRGSSVPPSSVGATPTGEPSTSRDLKRVIHQSIRRVSGDMEKLRFNTMLAALMELSNYLGKVKDAGAVSQADWDEAVRTLLLLLAPTAPHVTEELWSRLGLPTPSTPRSGRSGTKPWPGMRKSPCSSRSMASCVTS